MELLSDLRTPTVISNNDVITDIITAQFPTCRQEAECMFLLGNYLEQVDNEVISKHKELLMNTLVGVLKAKMVQIGRRAVTQVQIVLGEG